MNSDLCAFVSWGQDSQQRIVVMKKESERLSQDINQRDTNILGKLDFHVQSFKKVLNTDFSLCYLVFKLPNSLLKHDCKLPMFHDTYPGLQM